MKTVSSETELAAVVAAATSPLSVQGGGTRGAGTEGEVLSLSGLRGVSLYEPGALTLVAAAGTSVQEVTAVLEAENQRLAFEPMDHRGLTGQDGAPTIGGVVATNSSGPRRIQVGACRDHLLGVRYVDGRGAVIKNGGRVMKNVTGYDLVKLMAGSWGTLGVLSEVSLKVLPCAETEATLLVHGPGMAQAVAAMSAALVSPFEVTGAGYDPAGAQGPVVMIRIEGFEASVAYRTGRLRDVLRGFGEITVCEAAESARIWTDLRDVAPFQGAAGDIWRISVKPSDAPEVAARIEPEGAMFDWGGGLIWVRVPEGTDLRARAGVFDGHATLVRASRQTRARLGMFHPQPAAVSAISAGLRARFDPRGIFNPGMMTSPVAG